MRPRRNHRRVSSSWIAAALCALAAASEAAGADSASEKSAGADLFFSGYNFYEISLKTRGHAYFGDGGRGPGVAAYVELPHPYARDYGVGPAYKIATVAGLTVEGDVGALWRRVQGAKGWGVVGSITLAKAFTQHFRVSVPIIFKTVLTGTADKKTTVDYLPYLGVGVGL